MNIPEWLFRDPNENLNNILRRRYNPKPLREIARENTKIDKQLNKELAKKMINPYYFTDRILKKAFNINFDGHHINHVNSKLIITTKYLEIENIYVNKIMREMARIYARLICQYIFK